MEKNSSLLKITSSRRSVSQGAVQKTAREKMQKALFSALHLTNWTPGRGYPEEYFWAKLVSTDTYTIFSALLEKNPTL